MNKWFANIDLQHPLTDHPFWRNVRGVWVPLPQLRAGSSCAKLWDLSGYGNHVTQSTASYRPKWKTTERGLAINTYASDDVLSAGDKDCWTPSTDEGMTLLMRIRCGDWSKNCPFLNKYQIDEYEWTFGTVPAYNKTYFFVYDNSNTSFIGRKSPLPTDSDKWYTFSGTWDGGTTNSAIRIYKDGVRTDDSDYSSGLFLGVDNTTSPIQICGYNPGTGSSDVDKIVTCAAFMRRCISPSEAAFFHEQSLKGYPDLIRRLSPKKTFFITSSKLAGVPV